MKKEIRTKSEIINLSAELSADLVKHIDIYDAMPFYGEEAVGMRKLILKEAVAVATLRWVYLQIDDLKSEILEL